MSIFKLPDLGEGLHEAEIHEWYVKEGDSVKEDQPLVSMETAKAVVDVPSPFHGVIMKLHGNPGDIIETGKPLVSFEGSQSQTEPSENKTDAGTVVGNIEVGDTVIEESATGLDNKQTKQQRSRIKVSPAVRKLAKQLEVDLNSVEGTGPGNSITANDVKSSAETVAEDEGYEALHSTRRAMVFSMAKAHAEVVPATIFEDADVNNWADNSDTTVRLIRAIVYACRKEPSLNAHFDSEKLRRQLFGKVNLGLAVDTLEGLFVPVIKAAGRQDSETLRKTIERFKQQALAKQFQPADLQDATISLSNYGKFAGRYASPVIVPPCVAIVGVGKIREAVVAVNREPAVHKIIPISVTIDHRVVTGGEGTRFVAAMIEDLGKPD